MMSAVGCKSLLRLVRRLSTPARRLRERAARRRKAIPGLESLEPIALLSTVAHPLAVAVAAHDAKARRLADRHDGRSIPSSDAGTTATTTAAATPAVTASVTLPAQTISLASTLTNFVAEPLSPSLTLFNPALGTLTSVSLSDTTLLQSNITSQNLSTTSTTVITATLSGSDSIDGLNQPIVEPTQTVTSQPQAAGVLGSGTDTVTFPPLQIASSATTTYTDAASLAFFTASSGRTTITPTMTATGSGSASAPDGNLFTNTQTSATSAVVVTYTYAPPTPTPTPTPAPASCPGTGRIGRIGVHQQRTLLVLPFSGAVDPARASDPADYVVILRNGHRDPVKSADYNPATNTVTLRTKARLNVHYRYHLKVTLPCVNGASDMTVRLPFGTKYSLIGFHDHQGKFVPVRDGHIEKFHDQSRGEDRHQRGRDR